MPKHRNRGRGEGSIKHRADGRWEARITVDGKRRSLFGHTREEAHDKLMEALRNRKRGLPILSARQTVKGFLESWLADTVRPHNKPRTFESYELTARLHLIPTLGKLSLTKLDPDDVNKLLRAKEKEKLGARSVAYIRAVLRIALNDALRRGVVARNAAALVRPPRIPHHEIKPLPVDEARAFLEAVKGSRHEALYRTAISLGLRKGEDLGLMWSDLDLDGRTLGVKRTLQRLSAKIAGKPGLNVDEPKSRGSRRTIDLPAPLVETLRAHRTRQLRDRLAAGLDWRETGYVFTNLNGGPLDPRGVHDDFKRYLKVAGLPSTIRFHDLRHSAASLLLAQGVSLREIMELLGHSSIALTANTYGHILPGGMRNVADQMGAILG